MKAACFDPSTTPGEKARNAPEIISFAGRVAWNAAKALDAHARFRVDLDRENVEQSILEDLAARPRDTIVAFAMPRDTWD
ncbi:MAG: hypothetical protein JXO72_04350 [Vicinamibacteria bacterium]|nr:hypothetical protein [Vicinamibacteria bacterium]